MKNTQQGSLLVGLVITIAVIFILLAIMYGGNKDGSIKNLHQQNKEAQTQIKQDPQKLDDYQKQLNSEQ